MSPSVFTKAFIHFFILPFFLFSFSFQLSAQNDTGRIFGKLTSADNSAIEFANIVLKDTKYHVTTDADGKFSLEAPAGSYTLSTSMVGFKSFSKEVIIRSGERIEITGLTMTAESEMQEVTIREKSEIKKINEQGFNVNAIDLKSKYNLNSDLNQVLNSTTGVRIREEGGLGSNFNFSLNGFTGNQVKFFLDGIPMDNFGSSLTLNNFPTNMAERIEVYKGVLPVSLGTDALGGAINIVSRSNPNYLDLSYSAGSFNTHRASVNGAYTNIKTGFTVRTNTFYNYSDNDYKVLVPIKDLSTSSYGAEK